MTKEWTDWRDLAEDLINSINVTSKWLAWINQPLGSVQLDHVGLADVLAVYESYAPMARIYEIKISHGDFLRDLNAGKYLRYLPECNQLYFAAPKGIIKPNEVPAETGLMLRGDKGWHVSKGAPKRGWKPDITTLLALLFSVNRGRRKARNGLESATNNGKPSNGLGIYYDDALNLRELRDCDLRRFSRHYGHKVAQQIAEGRKLIPEFDELRLKVNRITGRECSDLESAVGWLRSDIERLIRERENIREVMDLHTVAASLNSNYGNTKTAIKLLERVLGELKARETAK